MVINFNSLEKTKIEKFKGGAKFVEAAMFVDDNNRIMSGTLVPGASIGLHTHVGSSEAIFITKGNCIALYDGQEEQLVEGMCHYCEEGHEHSLINNSDDVVEYLAVVPNHRK